MASQRVPRIAVVVPCFRVSRHIMEVLRRIGPEVARVFVVDDACPEHTGDLVERECVDPRVAVLRHAENLGVGGAMTTGYRACLSEDVDIVVKIDGDGQMDPEYLARIVRSIVAGRADYAKGNRFYDLELLRSMPRMRLMGNAALSIVNKISSGYWDIMDPTNGYTAIHRTALELVPLDKLDQGYFFESDMLFRLYTIRAVVHDVPMPAKYAGEPSSLRVSKVALSFPMKYLRVGIKRMFYSYFLRDFNAATVQFLIAVALGAWGVGFGAVSWIESEIHGIPATAGTVMLAALPILVAFQLLLSALQYDIANVPRIPLQQSLQRV
jgi:glycosyltransferase involved in cell wall biosynthesis